jgi:hypothetical protein
VNRENNMRRSNIRVTAQVFAGMAILLGLSIVAQSDEGAVELKTSEQALDRALAYAGFEQMKRFAPPSSSACATTATVVDSITPFLS